MKVFCFVLAAGLAAYGILQFDEWFMADQPTHVMKFVAPKAK
jgi:hypothetical protein